MGGITIQHAEAEQVLTGACDGVQVIVLSVKPDEESAQACWNAACSLVATFKDAGSEAKALIIDIANAQVRHAYITEMEDEDE